MPSYIVRSRKTGPLVDTTVTAVSEEAARTAVIATATGGDSIEVLAVRQFSGATGATGR